jgi:protein-tyrosine-phosphatase
VSRRRRSADGRDAYYSVDLARCGELLAAAGEALHPGLALGPPRGEGDAAHGRRVRVLFLCTGNSTRSQIAEALLRHHAAGLATAASAGSHPKPVHPHAVRAMRERGIDIAGRPSKHLDEFTGEHFDYVITLCDRLREICPEFPGSPEAIHWSIPDPAAEEAPAVEGNPAPAGEEDPAPAAEGDPDGTYPPFERTAAEIDTRVRFLVHLIAAARAAR